MIIDVKLRPAPTAKTSPSEPEGLNAVITGAVDILLDVGIRAIASPFAILLMLKSTKGPKQSM